MGLADPNASFEVASRHLFRHLADPKQLERNPLVRRFFDNAGAGRGTRSNAVTALTFVRDLVVRGAEQYKTPTVVAAIGREAAHRRHAIATAHCLDGRPLESVARELGLSMRQCYRERAEVMRRIASFIQAYDDRPKTDFAAILSEFRMQMDRAGSHLEAGDVDRALRDYDEIICSDPAGGHRVEALCKRADAQLGQGEYARCAASLDAAVDLLKRGEPALAPVARAAMHAHVDLVRSKLSWATGRFEDDTLALRSALAHVERVRDAAGDRVRELYATVLLETCDRHRTRGEFARARSGLVKAEQAIAALRVVPPAWRFDVMFESWQLGAGGAAFEGSGTNHLSRLESLTELSALARSAMSPRRSVRVALAFIQHYADVGDGVAALDWAKRTLRMARQHPAPRLFADMSIGVADWVASTSHWSHVPRLLEPAEGVFAEGSPDWILLQGLRADAAFMGKSYGEALVLYGEVERAAERMGNVRYQAATRTGIALTAHALGNRAEANERVHAALEVIDDYGTPWTRQATYLAAATISGDRRYRRKANEIRQRLKA